MAQTIKNFITLTRDSSEFPIMWLRDGEVVQMLKCITQIWHAAGKMAERYGVSIQRRSDSNIDRIQVLETLPWKANESFASGLKRI